MKKNIIIVILLIINLFIIVCLLSQRRGYHQNDSQQLYIKQLNQEYCLTRKYNGLLFDTSIKIRNIHDSLLNICDVLKSQKTLVFRYSFIHCNSCVDTIMKLVNGFANELDKDQVLILSQYANNRDYHNYVRINRVKLPLYDVRDSILIDSVLEQPYMFVLDKDMVCNNFYVPYKETPNLVKQYLKMIKNVIN